MAYVDFISSVHKKTKRDYLGRVNEYPKVKAAEKAKKWGFDYWDGDRRICYGGYTYDGRWQKVARAMAEHYGLKPGDKVLDVGCGKGFLLYDFTQLVPGIKVAGLDISQYAIKNAKRNTTGNQTLNLNRPFRNDIQGNRVQFRKSCHPIAIT